MLQSSTRRSPITLCSLPYAIIFPLPSVREIAYFKKTINQVDRVTLHHRTERCTGPEESSLGGGRRACGHNRGPGKQFRAVEEKVGG